MMPLVAVGLYVGLAKAGVFHNPLFVLTEGDIKQARSDELGLRVLFVGNSFTFYNDLPQWSTSARRGIRRAAGLFGRPGPWKLDA
jgi:hypothetical protein